LAGGALRTGDPAYSGLALRSRRSPSSPIIDFPFHGGPEALTFAPADRITYNLSQTWSLAVEHYADYGSFANLAPLGRQYHALFGVVDYNSDPLNLEFGIGHGFTAISESLILKLIVTRSF